MKAKLITLGIIFALVLVGIAGMATAEKKGKKAAHLYLYEKDPATWEIEEDGAWGKMKYYPKDDEFDFVFNGHGLEVDEDYSLIYYPEPQTTWPWPVVELDSGTSNDEGNIHLADSYDFNADMTGIKIWLVLTDDIVDGKMSGWNPTEYLFEHNLIDFDDTDV